MDLNTRSYSPAAAQQYGPAYSSQSRMLSSPFPTPPQTHACTQSMPTHTSGILGLSVLDCHANQQLPICTLAQSLLPAAVSWPDDQNTTQCYSNQSPNLDEYQGLNIYENIDTISATSSPFVSPLSNASIPNAMTFLTPPSMTRKPTNVMYQDPIPEDPRLQYRSIPVTRQSTTTTKRVKINNDARASQTPAQRAPMQPAYSPYAYETGYAVPAEISRDSANMLLELDHNIKRPEFGSRVQRETQHGLNNANPALDVSCSTTTRDDGAKKQLRKSTATTKGKHACSECGMQFTRKSNCKSHMKIHDPNRKFPHRCTVGQCTKQFSRKTDLVHKKLRRFGCSQCGHHFARQDTLRRHCEDGCRKQKRETQRAAATSAAAASVDCIPTSANPAASRQKPSSSSPYRELNPQRQQHLHPDQTQINSTFMRPTFLSNTHDMTFTKSL
ncbi:hypothetical protein PRK78_002835 [Emydomyces testavorans]|uniref:C2H2-type domain-containing protein n=1 Tax=Emydomyces testavorans TaxID=2070801 RepID=A0AAF0DFN4_9EURO|nr:hypothetical protein PRK78_002835 [Emydomyces testavorans]